jgi:hypothetical protein
MSEQALSMLLEHAAGQVVGPDQSIIERSIREGSSHVHRRRRMAFIGAVAAACTITAGTTWTISSMTRPSADDLAAPIASGSVRLEREDVPELLAGMLPDTGRASDLRDTLSLPRILGEHGADSISAAVPSPATVERAASLTYTERDRTATVGIAITRTGSRFDAKQLCARPYTTCTPTRAGRLVLSVGPDQQGPALATLLVDDWAVLVATSDHSVVPESLLMSIAMNKEWIS